MCFKIQVVLNKRKKVKEIIVDDIKNHVFNNVHKLHELIMFIIQTSENNVTESRRVLIRKFILILSFIYRINVVIKCS